MYIVSTNVKPIYFEVPLTPPSVNHYKMPIKIRTKNGMRDSYALTAEAEAWRAAVAVFAAGRTIAPATAKERTKIRYGIGATVYLGKNERGDGDNYWKCIADSLQYCGVIHSDARVQIFVLEVLDTERHNPRTAICAFLVDQVDIQWKWRNQ